MGEEQTPRVEGSCFVLKQTGDGEWLTDSGSLPTTATAADEDLCCFAAAATAEPNACMAEQLLSGPPILPHPQRCL